MESPETMEASVTGTAAVLDGVAREAAIDAALARSALYEAVALGLQRPTAENIERLTGADATAGLSVAAQLLGDEELARRVGELGHRPARLEELEGRFGALFGHTARGEVPAYETEYGAGDTFRQPQDLADIAGFYRAFGLTVSDEGFQRPDHASCECEFAAFLARREAVALERGDLADHETTARATRSFLRDHLSRFLPALGCRLERADVGGFYGALGDLAGALVVAECRRLDVAPGPVSLPLRSCAEDAVPMACGSCDLARGEDEDDVG